MISREHSGWLVVKNVSFACMSQSEAVMSVCGEVSQKSTHRKARCQRCEYFLAVINSIFLKGRNDY